MGNLTLKNTSKETENKEVGVGGALATAGESV